MKKVWTMAAATLVMLAGCENYDEERTEARKVVTFSVSGDFSRSYNEMTRATKLSDGNTAGMKDVWVLDYVDGVLVQTAHQTSTEASFGTVQMALAYGHHDVKLVASKGDGPSLTTETLSWAKVLDTFTLDYPIDVAASTDGSRSPELKRAVSGVRIVMTDAVPSNAASITISMDRSLGIILPSLGADDVQYTSTTLSIPQTWIGKSGGEISSYTICETDGIVTDVDVKVLDADGGTVSSFTVSDVELKRNRMTVLKGEVFGRGSGFAVSVDDEWQDENEVLF